MQKFYFLILILSWITNFAMLADPHAGFSCKPDLGDSQHGCREDSMEALINKAERDGETCLQWEKGATLFEVKMGRCKRWKQEVKQRKEGEKNNCEGERDEWGCRKGEREGRLINAVRLASPHQSIVLIRFPSQWTCWPLQINEFVLKICLWQKQ